MTDDKYMEMYGVQPPKEAVKPYQRPPNPDGSKRVGGQTRDGKAAQWQLTVARNAYTHVRNALRDLGKRHDKVQEELTEERGKTSELAAKNDELEHSLAEAKAQLEQVKADLEMKEAAARTMELFNVRAMALIADLMVFTQRHLSVRPTAFERRQRGGYVIVFGDGRLNFTFAAQSSKLYVSNSRLKDKPLDVDHRSLTAEAYLQLAAMLDIPMDEVELRVPDHVAFELFSDTVRRRRQELLGRPQLLPIGSITADLSDLRLQHAANTRSAVIGNAVIALMNGIPLGSIQVPDLDTWYSMPLEDRQRWAAEQAAKLNISSPGDPKDGSTQRHNHVSD
jgi:hypothetical protein